MVLQFLRRGMSLSDILYKDVSGWWEYTGAEVEQGKYENREAFATIQEADDGDSDQGVSSGGGEKWSDFG